LNTCYQNTVHEISSRCDTCQLGVACYSNCKING